MNNSDYVQYNEKGERLMTERQWEDESLEPPQSLSVGRIDVLDAPIYRGSNALGQQMVDIVATTIPGYDQPEARSRLNMVIKREKEIAEHRAAGTGGMVEGVGSDGGMLLQGETTSEMITNGFNNSEVLKRSSHRDIGYSQYAEIVGIKETSRANGSRGGGVRVYTDRELGLILQSKPEFDKLRLEPKKLTGLYYASNEILANAPLLQDEMSDLFNQEFSFKGQDLSVWGSGSGEALGVMNAPCLVTVPM